MTSRLNRLLLLLPWAAIALPGAAFAKAGGIAGYSGRTGATCTACHSQASAVPSVTLTGPTSLAAGQTGSYVLTITGGPAARSGIDVAASAGSLAAGDSTSRLSGSEVVQASAKAFSGGSVSYPFKWTAPSSAGSHTLWASGMSSNGSGTGGDGTGKTSLAITVTGAVPVCSEGQTRACYSGPAGTSGVGVCRAGTQSCTGNAWGPCTGQALPAAEDCSQALDEDCDGLVNEGCPAPVCAEGQTRACYSGPAGTSGVGACRAGTQVCSGNAWGACLGQTLPAVEDCAQALDEDCDGLLNEGCPAPACAEGQIRSCYNGPAGTSGVGACKQGIQTCARGAWGQCAGETLPSVAEVCGDGVDNDCNGLAEEGCAAPVCSEGETRACYSGREGTEGVGLCRAGGQTCRWGAWSACTGEAIPALEACENGLDEDCDGQADEVCGETCALGDRRACDLDGMPGVQRCSAEGWGSCRVMKLVRITPGPLSDPGATAEEQEAADEAAEGEIGEENSQGAGCSSVPGSLASPLPLFGAWAFSLWSSRRRKSSRRA